MSKNYSQEVAGVDDWLSCL